MKQQKDRSQLCKKIDDNSTPPILLFLRENVKTLKKSHNIGKIRIHLLPSENFPIPIGNFLFRRSRWE